MTIVRCAAAMLIVVLAAASSFGQSQPTPSLFVATYFAADGRIAVSKGFEHSFDQRLAGLQVQGPGVPFDSDLVRSTIPGTSALGFVDVSTPNEANWLFFRPPTLPAELVGVMPPRLSSETLLNDYISKYLLGGGGFGNLEEMDWRYVPVPEPPAGWLGGIASVAMLAARRRSSHPPIASPNGGMQ